MENSINLGVLEKDGGKLLEELGIGRMAVVRSKNDFLYITETGGEYRLYTHTPGSPGGAKKQLMKNEKNTAIVRNIASVSDSVYSVEFNKEFDVFGVMACAENAILSMFPGDDRAGDADIEFIIPGEETDRGNDPGENARERQS